MSRVHCLDCATDVVVDPLGHCPEGHLLPANGRRVSDAIGSHEPYPDEPEPWVGQVELEAPEPAHATATRSAQPAAAPGFAPAEREAASVDLLRELGALGSDEPVPSPTTPPAANGHAPSVNGHATTPNGHATAPGGDVPGARTRPGDDDPTPTPHASAAPPHATPHTEAGSEFSELSALEQALQSLEDDTSRSHPAPNAPEPAPAPFDDDLGRLFDDLGGSDGDASVAPGTAGDTSSEPPSTAPTTPPSEAPSEVTPPPATSSPSPAPTSADDTAEGEPPRATIDTMNFTAKGGPVGGGRRRRLFGR